MKYKFFLSYTYNVYKGTETIEEGEIVEIIRFRESVGEKFVDCLRSNEKHCRISLEALKFCAEEYHEPKKTSTAKESEMKLYDSGICYWAGKNPCTDCRDKSKCLECDKSFEYVLAIHNEIVKNIKENKNFLTNKI